MVDVLINESHSYSALT